MSAHRPVLLRKFLAAALLFAISFVFLVCALLPLLTRLSGTRQPLTPTKSVLVSASGALLLVGAAKPLLRRALLNDTVGSPTRLGRVCAQRFRLSPDELAHISDLPRGVLFTIGFFSLIVSVLSSI